MSITKKEATESRKLLAFKQRPKSREFPLVDGLTDRRITWPENASGLVVTRQQLEDFIGNQTLYQAQATAKRFIVIAAAAQQIARGKNKELNWRLIRYVASEDDSAGCQQMMKAMLSAIVQGEEGIAAACLTTIHLLDFGFEYMTSCNRGLIYEDSLKRMMQATERRN
ncbi:MAG TPA: hypothetical protein VJX74_14475 [Blastocatellia bacterium]|nr:hypothetical protein [Blastocatellia bacterium]